MTRSPHTVGGREVKKGLSKFSVLFEILLTFFCNQFVSPSILSSIFYTSCMPVLAKGMLRG